MMRSFIINKIIPTNISQLLKLVLLNIILLFSNTILFSQNDYTIQVNDTIFEVSLNTPYNIVIDNKDIQFKISIKDTLVYDDDFFSFKFFKDYKITHLDIAEGVEQIAMMSAEGTGLIIQKYSTINPVNLNEMMIHEVTKESLNYGFKMKRDNFAKRLKSGQELTVNRAILTYQDEINTYEIASIGHKDGGIIIMTMRMTDGLSDQGEKMINLMWDSLFYK